MLRGLTGKKYRIVRSYSVLLFNGAAVDAVALLTHVLCLARYLLSSFTKTFFYPSRIFPAENMVVIVSPEIVI